MCTATDCHIVNRGDRFFFRINDFQFFNPSALEFMPHYFCQRANRCFVYIRHFKRCGIHLITGTHGTDYRCSGGIGVQNKCNFPGNGINGIDNIIVLGKVKLFRCFRRIKGLICTDFGIRIDFCHAFGGNIYLILPDRFTGGEKLTVQIG